MHQDWTRPFGATGLTVSALGFGAGHVGAPAQTEGDVERLLNAVVDAGITLIDTARGYGLSEERIGRYLAPRRQEIVISTKVGYDIPGHADWSGPGITAGIDAALGRLRTDYLDIVHLHSCPVVVLEEGAVIEALAAAVAAGKVRVAAYSGDNEPLAWAVASGHFASIETSVNVFDQRVLNEAIPAAQTRGLGVIAKRPLGNAPWRFTTQPFGDYAETYWLRMQALGLDPAPYAWDELALRFVLSLPGVQSAIVGTASPENLRRNVELASRGPLDPANVAALRAAFAAKDDGWVGQV